MPNLLALIIGVVLVFFGLARFHARPGFNAIALGLFVAATPAFSRFAPGQGPVRDAITVAITLAAASLGTAIGGGLKDSHDDHQHHDHSHEHDETA